ncbi:rod shape-determining protein MreC [Pseudomarimonas arenosa]|uniref:Cell shape-determining protein MreC n=1 Tax=Pseudomarimonas arenosa TaxID=2774145 RepID=A0AAW3ZL78_9GAMM|nr:rod shape-determining protein MreC [Pseudomarimonas arenosa]MBD8525176.1 rod shape-determining protein MreC [Pseudomarimonas arenosa]
MPASSSPAPPLFSDAGAGTARLLGYLLLAIGLMVSDYRGDWLGKVRDYVGLAMEPLYQLAALPGRGTRWLFDYAGERDSLITQRNRLREELLVAEARLARLQQVQQENRDLRQLLGGTQGLVLRVRLAPLADFEVDPFRHRAVIELGQRDGLRAGTALIDGGGVYGQVIDVGPLRSTVMLISDPSHAIPVQVRRSGVRTVAYGVGQLDRLSVPNIPQSADIQVGDELITSGLGGRFPAGLPVAEISDIQADETRLFLVADAKPTAALDRGLQLLLVWVEPAGEGEVGPPRELASGGAP